MNTRFSVGVILFKIKMYAVVILENQRKLVVPEYWTKIVDGNFALIFHAKDKNARPRFENVHKQFHYNENRSYYGYILKNKFG